MTLSFSWLGKELALDFANTVVVVRPGEERDGVETRAQLDRWLELERDRLGSAPGAAARLGDFRRLRDALRRLFAAAAAGGDLPAADVAVLNEASAAAPRVVQLHETAVVESLAGSREDAILGAIAVSAVELLGGPGRDRVRVCDAPSCGLSFLAVRERQQWCTPSCGNRARVARHYARRARSSGPAQ